MSTTMSVRLDEKTIKQLEDMAVTINRPKSHLIREAIEQYVAEHVDYRIALDRLTNVHDETISSEEMGRLLADED